MSGMAELQYFSRTERDRIVINQFNMNQDISESLSNRYQE